MEDRSYRHLPLPVTVDRDRRRRADVRPVGTGDDVVHLQDRGREGIRRG